MQTFNSKCMDFLTSYKHLPAHLQTEVRDKIVKACGWGSLKTFYNKKKKPASIKPIEAKAIEQVFEEYGITVNLKTKAA